MQDSGDGAGLPIRHRVRLSLPHAPRLAVLGAFAVALLALLAFGEASARAGIQTIAKRETKTALAERSLQSIKLGCRQIGKKGADGVRCRWVAAERRGSKTFSCRGTGELPSRAASLRFKTTSCKPDRGGTELTKSMPDRLGKKDLEATDSFCWGLLGRGFKCSFEAIRFADRTYDCTGTATHYRNRFKIRKRNCAVDSQATQAQGSVGSSLLARGLHSPEVRCRDTGQSWRCDWRAYSQTAGWNYHCDGVATAASLAAAFDLDPCRLRAPERSPLGPPNPQLLFGVNESWGVRLGEVPRAAALGSDTLRTTLNWASVEFSPGNYYWDAFDATYSRMLSAGVRPLFILMGAPCWATQKPGCRQTEGSNPPAPAFDAAWRTFAAEVARRYPQAAGIEVWNEPNYAAFYAGGPDPERYAKLLELAHDGVKSVAPKMPVISGGLAAFTKNGKGKLRYDTFLRRVLEAGGAGNADAIGHHSYSGRRLRHGHIDGLRLQLAELKDVMVDFGEQGLPFWITETGISSASKGISEKEQAKTNVKAYKMLRKTPGVEAVIFHRWRDFGRSGAESGYGLTSRKGKAKRALCALAAARGQKCPK